MRIIPSQSSTQKTIICKFAGLQVKDNVEPPITAPEELAAVKTASKFLKGATSVSERPKVWIVWLRLYRQRILGKEPNDEFCLNLIRDEKQLHTSTRSELG